jgi:hypothetical protein
MKEKIDKVIDFKKTKQCMDATELIFLGYVKT